ncbi:MAG: hypothetical protein V1744_03375 [Candidatus Altiarchaeota archaeon]
MVEKKRIKIFMPRQEDESGRKGVQPQPDTIRELPPPPYLGRPKHSTPTVDDITQTMVDELKKLPFFKLEGEPSGGAILGREGLVRFHAGNMFFKIDKCPEGYGFIHDLRVLARKHPGAELTLGKKEVYMLSFGESAMEESITQSEAVKRKNNREQLLKKITNLAETTRKKLQEEKTTPE